MSQLDPTIELPLAAPPRRALHGRLRVPGWVALLLRNRKSRTGLAMVLFMVVVALIAPLISVAHPNDFNLLAARQAPSWHHLFGTTDQGSDIFSQVVLGARRSLLLGAAAGALATALAAFLGITAAGSSTSAVTPRPPPGPRSDRRRTWRAAAAAPGAPSASAGSRPRRSRQGAARARAR